MHVSLSLLFLFIGSTWTKKQGDFGIFKACTVNNSLRLLCSYAHCEGKTPYDCEFRTSDGLLLAKRPGPCVYDLLNHTLEFASNITSYSCHLTRRKRTEEQKITIDYSITNAKKRTRPCSRSAGVLLDPVALWLALGLSLWRVLAAGLSQTT